MVDVVLVVSGCVGLVWLARRIEPHWSSRDGHRFIARTQSLGVGDSPEGGWVEVRGSVDGDHVTLVARGRRSGSVRGTYRVVAKSGEPPRGKAVYLLAGDHRVVLRVPRTSHTVAVLDRLLRRVSDVSEEVCDRRPDLI